MISISVVFISKHWTCACNFTPFKPLSKASWRISSASFSPGKTVAMPVTLPGNSLHFFTIYWFNILEMPGLCAYWSAITWLTPWDRRCSNKAEVESLYLMGQAFSSNHSQIKENMLFGKMWTWASITTGSPSGILVPSSSLIYGRFGLSIIKSNPRLLLT